MSVTESEVPAFTDQLDSALARIGITQITYEQGAYSILSIHDEGDLNGRIFSDRVEVTINWETTVFSLSDHDSLDSLLRTIDYNLRYAMSHRFNLPQSVPADFKTGDEIQE